MEKENLFPEDAEHELSEKHKAFCREYIKDYNASAAARRCGYTPSNAAQTGSRILQNPLVLAYIEEEQALKNAGISTAGEAASNELVTLTFADRSQFFDERGKLKSMQDMPKELLESLQISTTITSVENDKRTSVTLTLPSKIQLFDRLSKRELKKIFKDAEQKESIKQGNKIDLGDGKVMYV